MLRSPLAALTALVILSGMNSFIPTSHAAPVTKPGKQLSTSQSNFLIVPNKSVGKITKQTDRPQLAKLYGEKNVEDYTQHGPEGIGDFPATRVTIGGKPSLSILWEDDSKQGIRTVEILDTRWHTADGMALYLPLTVLQKRFGQFSFYGFGWDYGGLITTGNAKLDQYRKQSGLYFSLQTTPGRCQAYQADCRAVSGDSEFSTDNPHLKHLQTRIATLGVKL
jgi:hypothetical protein